MPKNFSRKTYDRWIKKNKNRFKYKPYIIESRKNYFTLRFYGVTNELTLCIEKSGHATIFIHDSNGLYWDMIRDFDIIEKRTSTGKYYCGLCIKPVYYETRTLLWEDHIFNDALLWINELEENTWIGLFGIPEETFWGAELFTIQNLTEKRKEFYNNYFPLILGKE